MNIYDELNQIASAKYGLQLKDPIFNALDILIRDPKFELLDNVVDNDYKEIDDNMNLYYQHVELSYILRNLVDIFSILNGRKGFYSKKEEVTKPEETISYWINMLIEELMNSSTGQQYYDTVFSGSGIVNGSRMRAAIYYILDILHYNKSVAKETHTLKFSSHGYILGKEISKVTVYGNEDGVGELLPGQQTYSVTIKVSQPLSIFYSTQEITLSGLSRPLYEGESYIWELTTPKLDSFQLYELELERFNADVEIDYSPLRDHYNPNVNDYIYEMYGEDNLNVRTLLYKGTDKRIIMPTHFESINDTLKSIGPYTFADSKIEAIIVPEGVEIIE